MGLFHCKDRDSFDECLQENYGIPSREERTEVQQLLAATKHTKLILKIGQPPAYRVVVSNVVSNTF